MFRVLDLFSGIGGFSLGLERTGGFQTVAFCEIEPFARHILAKHWPGIPVYDDVRHLSAERLGRDGIHPDVLCGGFPCQDISLSNVAGDGLDGERSGLWREYARLVGELRPRYVLVENVAALLVRGMDRVLGDLAALGYDAEWHCIQAADVGAPHTRDRAWIVAYPAQGERRPLDLALRRHSWVDRIQQRQEGTGRPPSVLEAAWGGDAVLVADALSRMDDGPSIRLDGFNACANAVVPAIPEAFGTAILTFEARQ